MSDDTVIISTEVPVSLDDAWAAYTSPRAIVHWNFASHDWQCPWAECDLAEGGRYVARMEAKDGSVGFDFAGNFEAVDPPNRLVLRLDDGRHSVTTFEPTGSGTRVQTAFEPDSSAPADMQRAGWQSILDNYHAYLTR